jgi:hypothetical protein
MRAMLGDRPLKGVLSSKLGPGSCVLFKYGPGSAGDLVLKQLFSDTSTDVYSVIISTHETVEEVRASIKAFDIPREPEIISLVPLTIEGLGPIKRKDHFRAEGLMVTDLLDMAGRSQERRSRADLDKRMLSVLTTVSTKQVLPFNLVLDSLSDLAALTSLGEIRQRLQVLKEALREKKGTAYMGAPLSWDPWEGSDLTMFDAIIEVRALQLGGTWKRFLRFSNIKGSPALPEEQELTFGQSIPSAIRV